jgi:hypothetical protein
LRLLVYHFLVDGSGIVRLGDGAAIELEPGDVVVVPHGDAHEMCSVQRMGTNFSEAMIAKLQTRDLTAMHAGGGGEVARFVCGYMVCDPLLCRPILQSLPPAFKVNLRTDRSGQWLETTLLHLVEEAAGSAARTREAV